jgi:hypothetical protein
MEVSGQLEAPAALPPGKEPPVPIGRLGGPQSRSGRHCEKNSLHSAGNRTQVIQLVAILIELPQFPRNVTAKKIFPVIPLAEVEPRSFSHAVIAGPSL